MTSTCNSQSGLVSSVRGVLQNSVLKLAKYYIEKGFNQALPLTVGIVPLAGPVKEVSSVVVLFLSEPSFCARVCSWYFQV